MTVNLPTWALQKATPQDRERAEHAQRQGTIEIRWPDDGKALRRWAKGHGWPAPWFNFDGGFIKKMFESDEKSPGNW